MGQTIRIGDQTYVSDGGEPFGAVRRVRPEGKPEVLVWVENAGEFRVSLEAVTAVHAQKVVFDCGKLDSGLRAAIAHAHDAEEPGL